MFLKELIALGVILNSEYSSAIPVGVFSKNCTGISFSFWLCLHVFFAAIHNNTGEYG